MDYSEQNKSSVSCEPGKIPAWLVVLDNIPTLVLFVLGALIIKELNTAFALLFFIYALLSVVWFWGKICPWCPHYGTLACPCGYGAISPRLFRKRDPASFRKVFRRNIIVVFPNWFVPSAVAAYLLISHFDKKVLAYSIVFAITGFIIIPLISKLAGCKNCKIKDDCPWMSAGKNRHN